ncbi:MAG: type II secretion system F family protein [Chloroflexi bacterium]|nr:type II secretion system F family protein [Chloroflexota bacterium]
MTSSPSWQKRSARDYFEEISSFDLFYQLTYMSATAAAGLSRARVFQLARALPSPTAKFFQSIHELAEKLRYNYPDAVRLVGEQTQSEETKNFLLRLSDALRSGEPLAGFLARESDVQGEHYSNDYLRKLESLKKWNDAYTSVTVSVALIVVINMVSTMIYNLGATTMFMMMFVGVLAAFGVAWILMRAAPAETNSVPLGAGSKDQRLSRQILLILLPVLPAAVLGLMLFGVDKGWAMIVVGLVLLPLGIVCSRFDATTNAKDTEISSFLRSVGGTATSRGTTLGEALYTMKIDSFPNLQQDIRMLILRLRSLSRPGLSWNTFGFETGSKLAQQATGIFYEAVNLGGDPEKAGNLTSAFAMRTAMLRAQRRGIAATFSWLILTMHTILSGLMVFLLGIMGQFAIKLNAALSGLGGNGADAFNTLGLDKMFSFNTPQIQFLETMTVSMILLLAFANAFAIVASEGAHFLKIAFYLAILLFLSGLCFLFVPSLARMVL